MPVAASPALAASRWLLRVLVALNLLMGVFILVLLGASLVAEAWVLDALGVAPGPGRAAVALGMRAVMVLGLASVPLAHRVLTRLLEVVATVESGDPFVAENAARLQSIAWLLLGLELLHMAVGAVAAAASSPAQEIDLDWNFSATAWLAILLLFVLARVFDEGARMRADLEGTV